MLTPCGLVLPYGDIDLVNIGLDNGLLPAGTKQLPVLKFNPNKLPVLQLFKD